MTNLNKLVTLTQERIKAITAQDIADMFPVLTDLERRLLSGEIRNEDKVGGEEYYRRIGQTLEMIIYRLTQEKVEEEI